MGFNDSIVNLENVLFSKNRIASPSGATIHAGDITIKNSVITENYCEYAVYGLTVALESGEVSNNNGTGVFGMDLEIGGGQISGNTGNFSGGAAGGDITVSGVIITENSASNGGGMYGYGDII